MLIIFLTIASYYLKRKVKITLNRLALQYGLFFLNLNALHTSFCVPHMSWRYWHFAVRLMTLCFPGILTKLHRLSFADLWSETTRAELIQVKWGMLHMQCLLNRSFCFSCPGAEGTDCVSVYFWSEYYVGYQHTINYTTDVLSHWNQFAGVMSSSVSTVIFFSLKFAVSNKWCTFLILPCCSRLEYFDEAVRDPASQTAVPVDIHQPPAFLHKILQLSAVQLFYDSNGIVQVMETTLPQISVSFLFYFLYFFYL